MSTPRRQDPCVVAQQAADLVPLPLTAEDFAEFQAAFPHTTVSYALPEGMPREEFVDRLTARSRRSRKQHHEEDLMLRGEDYRLLCANVPYCETLNLGNSLTYARGNRVELYVWDRKGPCGLINGGFYFGLDDYSRAHTPNISLELGIVFVSRDRRDQGLGAALSCLLGQHHLRRVEAGLSALKPTRRRARLALYSQIESVAGFLAAEYLRREVIFGLEGARRQGSSGLTGKLYGFPVSLDVNFED